MSTKTKKKLTLPKGLPPLPAIPDGYDAWEYLGQGPLGKELWDEYATSCTSAHNKSWSKDEGIGQWCGDSHDHYIRAVKRPAPSKKQPKVKAVNSARILNRSANQAARAAVKEIEAMSGQPVELSDCVKLVNAFASAIESLGIIPKRKGAK